MMKQNLYPIRCPSCGKELFKANLTVGLLEVACSDCGSIIYLSVSNDKPNNSVVEVQFPWEMYKEMKIWIDIATRKLRRGESLDFDFTSETITQQAAVAIRRNLKNAKTQGDVQEAFNIIKWLTQ